MPVPHRQGGRRCLARSLGRWGLLSSRAPLMFVGQIFRDLFRYMGLAEAVRVRCDIFQLKEDASLLWEGAEKTVDMETLDWVGFKKPFRCDIFQLKEDASLCGKEQKRLLTWKLWTGNLRYGDVTVAEYVKKFDRGCHFSPLTANDPAEKLQHFLDGLGPNIRKNVLMRILQTMCWICTDHNLSSCSGCKTSSFELISATSCRLFCKESVVSCWSDAEGSTRRFDLYRPSAHTRSPSLAQDIFYLKMNEYSIVVRINICRGKTISDQLNFQKGWRHHIYYTNTVLLSVENTVAVTVPLTVAISDGDVTVFNNSTTYTNLLTTSFAC
ncbi:hypothetical protein F511_25710 [Dorcoceras hygrometricum]|uniref:Retrotransposon gag domain-containing protein n=1 Tax=Dorcoceras hygrometricum TaxID=472368 RepID=A0A2Z7AG67_9LAMI|nr:hypothetical protein F511_25710 [Dorcoceras hygrometricum]